MSDSRKLLVLYGSQTGTAQEVAERVGREGKRLHFDVVVSAFDGFNIAELPLARLVVYVTSTTGQGEEPDNMKRSWRLLLRKSLSPQSLAGQHYGVLGLGDSSYLKFNIAAKKLNRRLHQLGGKELLPIGLGDDQHDLGPDFVIDPWLEMFWERALQLYPLPSGLQPIGKDVMPEAKYRLIWLDEESVDQANEETVKPRQESRSGQDTPYCAPVKSCDRVTPQDHFQDVRLVKLDLSGFEGLKYDPGDVAVVQPSNLKENVDFFFTLFPTLNPERKFRLEMRDPNVPLPSRWLLPRPCTIREAVEHYFDIQSIPKRYFFELLAHFTTDDLEKEKFQEFNTAEGQQDLYEYCNRPRRHILEVLYDFRHTTPNIPFDYLFDLIPAIKPRSFSIASSQAAHGSCLELLVAVVRYRSNLKAPRLGLCSNWLASLDPGSMVPVWIKKGTLRFPEDPSIPCVMVGPGTGVAPFRSFITSEVSRKSKRKMVLFFGSRNMEADFFFESDWKEARGIDNEADIKPTSEEDVSNLWVVTAFSRDQEDKVYVQHRMEESRWSNFIRSLVFPKSDSGSSSTQSGMFFVAGNSRQMPTQVREALVASLTGPETGLTAETATQFVDQMEKTNRYQTETWG